MKFIDFFSGIGGFRLGMGMAGHECVGHCEIDKYADKSYRAMHNVKESEWYANDITRVEPGDLPDADVYCGGFPCQSFSIAGKRGGFEDTRGTLFFEVMRLAVVRKPTYLFLENVKGLLSHDNGNTFATILESLWECGYHAEWQVLNSKDFGVPQNRERVFIVGHLGGKSEPKVFPITNTDGEVNDSKISQVGNLYADSKRENPEVGRVYGIDGISPCLNTMGGGQREPKIAVTSIGNTNPSGNGMNGQVYDSNGLAPTLTTNKGEGNKIAIREATIKGYAEAEIGDSVNIGIPTSETRRGRVGKGIANTLTTQAEIGVVVEEPAVLRTTRTEYGKEVRKKYESKEIEEQRKNMTRLEPRTDGITNTISTVEKDNYLINPNLTIRKLTPKECFRLQGFPDECFNKAAEVNSDSQLYKQAGNSVTVNVIYEIARRLHE